MSFDTPSEDSIDVDLEAETSFEDPLQLFTTPPTASRPSVASLTTNTMSAIPPAGASAASITAYLPTATKMGGILLGDVWVGGKPDATTVTGTVNVEPFTLYCYRYPGRHGLKISEALTKGLEPSSNEMTPLIPHPTSRMTPSCTWSVVEWTVCSISPLLLTQVNI
jgi:hypothetical protein